MNALVWGDPNLAITLAINANSFPDGSPLICHLMP